MFFFLPPVSIGLLTFLLQYHQLRNEPSRIPGTLRRSFLISLLIHAFIVFLSTELLSTFNGISVLNTRLIWSGVVAVEFMLIYKFYGKNDQNLNGLTSSFLGTWKTISLLDKWLIFAILVLYLLPLLCLSVFVPPNNFDAHSYHLTRIIEWLGNNNINHFPTRHNQQLYHNVFAEYMVMHTFLLTESDTFAGTVQFLASIGSILACSLITLRMGGSIRAQILASVMIVTLPIGILESTSVQVDYVACFFFMSFLYFGFEALDVPRKDTLVAMAISLAFGAFSKYTIFMFALPFCVYFGIRFLSQLGILGATRIFALFTAMLFLVFAPFMYRNYTFFGHILSPVEGTGLEVENLSAGEFSFMGSISGIIKNIGLHLGLPFGSYNAWMENLVAKVHQMMGVNLNPVGMDSFSVRFVLHEDMAPNTMHFAILAISLLGLLFIKGNGRLKWFAFCSCMGFAIFSSLMVFQLWSSRTHMPFFAMGCIISAIVLDHFLNKKTAQISLLLILSSISFVLANPSKPLLPLRYYSKKILNYAPANVCPQNKEQEYVVKNTLSNFYVSTPNSSNCYVSKDNIEGKDQKKIFEALDAVGYFKEEREETIFSLHKNAQYFSNHPESYNKFKDLIKQMKNVNENIGVLFNDGNGYYHYWAALQGEKYSFGQMKYIGYLPKYAELENAQNQFSYQYIFGDNPKLLAPYHNKNLVDTIYYSKGFYLAKLRHKVSDKLHL